MMMPVMPADCTLPLSVGYTGIKEDTNGHICAYSQAPQMVSHLLESRNQMWL